MKQALLLAISLATERYQQRTLRPGYPQTLADTQLSEALDVLGSFKIKIQESLNDLDAFNLLTDRLTDIDTDWTPYAFNSYLIDALKTISLQKESPIAPIDWDCFTPSAVKLFEGVLYRGTSSAPEKVFEKGFVDYNPSPSIADYIKPRNMNVGVSTTRSFRLAESYTHVASRQGGRRFVYTILYKGTGATDIIETAKARGIKINNLTNPQLTRALEKDEVNIIGYIAPEHIYCATEFLEDNKQITTYNPKFNPNVVSDSIQFIKNTTSPNFLVKIHIFFSSIISFFKVLIWSLKNQQKMSEHGNEYRKKEINENPIMKEAEELYQRIHRPKNSYEMVQGNLIVSSKKFPIISPEPMDATQIDNASLPRKNTSNGLYQSLDLNEDAHKLGEPVALYFARS